MTRPSKGGVILLTLFGLPFLGMGLLFVFAQISKYKSLDSLNIISSVIYGLAFAGFGGGLIYAAFAGNSKLKKQAEIEAAHPQTPWLWRTDWAGRRAKSHNKDSQIGWWIAAIFCSMIFFPFVAMIAQKYRGNGDPGIFVAIGLSVTAALLITGAVRATIRRRRFGDAYFEFDALPFSPGERMSGRIHLKLDTRAEYGIALRLECARTIRTGLDGNRTTSRVVLWKGEKSVPSGAIGPGPLGRAIPVEFELPPDAHSTTHQNLNDQVTWTLYVRADVPGVNYTDKFEIPVFRSAKPALHANDAQAPAPIGPKVFGFPRVVISDQDGETVARPANAKVIVTMQSGRTEFNFPAFRTPARALILFGVCLLWSGLVYLMYLKHAPWFFFVAFGFADLFILAGFLHVTFGSARIAVGNGEILWRRGILGLGAPRRIPFDNVESVTPTANLGQGGSSAAVPFAIQLRTKDGRVFTLADEIASRQEVRWVVSQIESLVGLRTDTHVQVELPLGAALQPPQETDGSQLFQTQPRQSSVGSIALFVLIAVAMFGWQAWRMFSFGARAPFARAAAAGRTKTIAPRVFSKPMTDADAERVMALPFQQQAEELLERAIGHDERALHMFNEQVSEWVGHIQMTNRTKQLERRSEFSRDLRVRQANADLNLALEGWHKNEEAVDALMERARDDQQHRAWAVYYLGMLAGRGVDYERIHDVILGYARNDPDPFVRQWAVEGMRFLGTNEALDELFASFAEDPSTAVRNRAGCNVSDCGIFTRKQRMRMVPKFLELVNNPQTSAQMRSWSFLALQEITDENLPADAMAWSRWYEEHGDQKMAEFERLDWWQVRGDE